MTTRIPTMYGRYYVLTCVWRGREFDITVFRSKLQKLQRPQAQRIAQSIYPNSKVIKFHESDPTDGPVVLATESLRQAKMNIGRDPDKKTCWKGYKAKGTKMKGGKSVPNCVKEEDIEEGLKQARKNVGASTCWAGYKAKGTKKKGGKTVPNCVKELADFMDEAKKGSKKKKPQVNGEDNHDAGNLPPAVNGGAVGESKEICKEGQYFCNDDQKCKPIPKGAKVNKDGILEGAAWTKKSGKKESGGLNEKGRKSYERENPGSDLKAPSKKKGNKRRARFCARMKGMKKKLTSKKTASDPDSRINKSLRAWNC